MRTYAVRSLVLVVWAFSLSFTACDTKVDDAVLTAKVKAQMTADGRVSPTRVNVDTLDGVVTLKGEVPTQQEKGAAEAVTRTVAGVKRVNNQITVNSAAAGTGMPTGNEMKEKAKEAAGNAAQEVKKETTEAVMVGTVKARLIGAGYSNVSSNVNNGEVTLTGEVKTEKDHIAVEAIVAKINGVKKVNNQTTVKGATPTPRH